jgi:RimJ/RimL family protein N-acetyltransferase
MLIDFLDIVKKKYPNNYLHYFNVGKNMIFDILKIDYIDNINENFIDNILNSNNIKIMFYSNTNKFSIKDNIGISVYYIIQNNKNIKFYLLLFGINKKYRNLGYGTEFLVLFIKYCKSFDNPLNKNKSIILHSLNSSYNFYKSLGFIDVNDDKHKYRKLFQYEKYDKNSLILKLQIISIVK